MNKDQLYLQLLKYDDLFLNNKYLKKYINIIYKKYTNNDLIIQKHHIIPQFYYYKNNLSIDNTNNNLIKLSYYNHVKAHYYLCKCVTNKYKSSCIHAFNILFNKQFYNLTEKELNELLPLQEEYQLEFLKLKSEIGKKNTGGVYVNKDNISKHILIDERQTYLDNGWELGSIFASLGGQQIRNKIWITNGVDNKRVFLEDFEVNYKLNGYVRGRSNFIIRNKQNTNANKIHIYKDDIELCIDEKDLDEYLKQGYKRGGKKRKRTKQLSEKSKNNMKNSNWLKGKKVINNGTRVIAVLPSDLDIYLNNGWNLGRGGIF